MGSGLMRLNANLIAKPHGHIYSFHEMKTASFYVKQVDTHANMQRWKESCKILKIFFRADIFHIVQKMHILLNSHSTLQIILFIKVICLFLRLLFSNFLIFIHMKEFQRIRIDIVRVYLFQYLLPHNSVNLQRTSRFLKS